MLRRFSVNFALLSMLLDAINVERNSAASSSAARRNLRPSYIEREAKITTHTTGKRRYKAAGTSASSSTFFMIEMDSRELVIAQ